MKRANVADAMWLMIERGNQPMHVGGLQLFDLPEGATAKWLRELSDQFSTYQSPEPPFSRLPVRRGASYWWKDEPAFDLEHHFAHTALAKPGRIRELLEVISREHSNRLDRSRPLWGCHLIEGLPKRQFAMYTKISHSMMDGIAATRHMQRMLSEDPKATDLPPPWACPRRTSTRGPRDPWDAFSASMDAIKDQISSVPTVGKALIQQLRQGRSTTTDVSPFQAPRSPINVPVSGSRRFAAQSWSMERIQGICKAFDCTVNDVVLSMCSTALREYLTDLRALPRDPLIAMVPVSFRPKGDAEAIGNQVGMILVNLATNHADPEKRLRQIQASIGHSKERLQTMSPAAVVNYSAALMSPMLMPLLTGKVPGKLPFNVIISNVPGPQKPLYLNGARLAGSYPVSIVIDGVALNITCVSYAGNMEFGLIGCRRALPKMQRMLEHLETGMKELEHAAAL